MALTKEHCKEGFDKNPEEIQKSSEEKEKDWGICSENDGIIKDLMNGNANLPEGCEEERVWWNNHPNERIT